ncbi:MAG TPA: sugar phosphate isomerase/epimerase family protein [Terriglobia bacterium]|nr:sugar phosphate isomerase/epimerase family protein [Terriglobia bacterium]
MKTVVTVGRREFLAACGAAVGAATLAGARPAVPDAGRVRFGVRTPLPREMTLRERAQLVKKLGYDGIELGGEWLDQPVERIQEQLAGVGIAVSAITGSIKLIDIDPQARAQAVETDRKRLEMAKVLGASDVLEVPTFGPNRFQDISPLMTPREIEERLLVIQLKQLAPDVQRTGVNLMLEACNQKETHFMYLQSQAAGFVEAVGAPGFKLISDFYHMQLEEKDIAATLRQYGKYTVYVHLADGQARTEPGSLPFDYRPGFRALKDWGFSGWLNMEFRPTDNPEAALARALAYIRKQWEEA